MTVEETRALMLSVDELREIYEQVKRTGEPQRLYLLEGDYEGPCYHGLPFLGWACFRSREDAEVWEAATLGHCKEEAV
jgi:hypothetical protein